MRSATSSHLSCLKWMRTVAVPSLTRRFRHSLKRRLASRRSAVRNELSTPTWRRQPTIVRLGDRQNAETDRMSGRLAGKTVVITGAGSGQGRAGAVLFAREGARLALCDIDVEGLAGTADLVAAESDVEVLSLRCDVSAPPEIAGFVEAVVEHFGAIDVIYN